MTVGNLVYLSALRERRSKSERLIVVAEVADLGQARPCGTRTTAVNDTRLQVPTRGLRGLSHCCLFHSRGRHGGFGFCARSESNSPEANPASWQ
jgi:hypothetical protein